MLFTIKNNGSEVINNAIMLVANRTQLEFRFQSGPVPVRVEFGLVPVTEPGTGPIMS